MKLLQRNLIFKQTNNHSIKLKLNFVQLKLLGEIYFTITNSKNISATLRIVKRKYSFIYHISMEILNALISIKNTYFILSSSDYLRKFLRKTKCDVISLIFQLTDSRLLLSSNELMYSPSLPTHCPQRQNNLDRSIRKD